MTEKEKIEKIEFISFLRRDYYKFKLEMNNGDVTDELSLFEEYSDISEKISEDDEDGDYMDQFMGQYTDPYNYHDEYDDDEYWEARRKMHERAKKFEGENPSNYYRIENIKKIIITGDNLKVNLKLLSSIPTGVCFENIGSVDMRVVSVIPDDCEFLNDGKIIMGVLEGIGNNVVLPDPSNLMIKGIKIGSNTLKFDEDIFMIEYLTENYGREDTYLDKCLSIEGTEKKLGLGIEGISPHRCLKNTMDHLRDQ